jgi:acetoin:2,6-dichlorophenolindophenol oxidoreductase subunit alpha
MDLSRETPAEMYRRMFRSRSFELAAIEKMKTGQIPGALHTSVGQEASIVGSCMALREDDYMVGNHRSHGHPIGKGARPDRLFAELMGKATGINAGMGGSMHLSDFSVGSLGETSIVGSGLPVATGAASPTSRFPTAPASPGANPSRSASPPTTGPSTAPAARFLATLAGHLSKPEALS